MRLLSHSQTLSGAALEVWLWISNFVPHIIHTIDMLQGKFQWILPLYMKPISFQSKASVVYSVTTAIFIDFCLKRLNVFPNILAKNKWISEFCRTNPQWALSAPYHCCLYKHRQQDERQSPHSSWPVPICTETYLSQVISFMAISVVCGHVIDNMHWD